MIGPLIALGPSRQVAASEITGYKVFDAEKPLPLLGLHGFPRRLRVNLHDGEHSILYGDEIDVAIEQLIAAGVAPTLPTLPNPHLEEASAEPADTTHPHLSDELYTRLRSIVVALADSCRLSAAGRVQSLASVLTAIRQETCEWGDDTEWLAGVVRDLDHQAAARGVGAAPPEALQLRQLHDAWVAEGGHNPGYVSGAGALCLPRSVVEVLQPPRLVRFLPAAAGAFLMTWGDAEKTEGEGTL